MSHINNQIANFNAMIQEQQEREREARNAEERRRAQQNIANFTTSRDNFAANYGVCPHCGRVHN